jgi:hypothetical protein
MQKIIDERQKRIVQNLDETSKKYVVDHLSFTDRTSAIQDSTLASLVESVKTRWDFVGFDFLIDFFAYS